MELPKVSIEPKKREVTGEIAYLNEMRRLNQVPATYLELGDLAIQQYETEASFYGVDARPEIMDEYEKYDTYPSEAVATCQALADALFALKDEKSPWTFVDIVIDKNPAEVLEKLKKIRAGNLLTADDEQLAILSDGSYYPILNFKKDDAQLLGTGMRVFGWDNPKYVRTDNMPKPNDYPRNILFYPSDEKSSIRQIELNFYYATGENLSFSESIGLYITSNGSVSLNRHIWSSAYAETGYEGHHHAHDSNVSDADIIAFSELVAEIVGDEPESHIMRINRQLQELIDSATPSAQEAIQTLLDTTSPVQAYSFLHRTLDEAGLSIAQKISNVDTAELAIKDIHTIIDDWKGRLKR